MPISFKPTVLIVLFLAVAFCVFFFVVKDVPSLAHVNPFAEDPFDAVGGFGVQLTLFTALLSLLRTFVPRLGSSISASQKLLVIRGCTVSVQSVAVTLAAYVVAMIRYPSLWLFSPEGKVLALLVAGMTVLAALTAWRIDLLAYNAGLSSDYPARRMALINSLAGVLILGIYPPEWHQGILGSVLTAMLGVVVLLTLTWSLAAALSPHIDIHIEDFLDDIAALGRWLKSKGNFLGSVVEGGVNVPTGLGKSSTFSALNPRKHPKKFALLVSLIAGILLALYRAMAHNLFSDPGKLDMVAVASIDI